MESATPVRFFEDAFLALLHQLLASDIAPTNQRDVVQRVAERAAELANVMTRTIDNGKMSAADARTMTHLCRIPLAPPGELGVRDLSQQVIAPQYGGNACR
jgi:hypothetical protein